MTPERAAKRRGRNVIITIVAVGLTVAALRWAPFLFPIPAFVAVNAFLGTVHYGAWISGYEAGFRRAEAILRTQGRLGRDIREVHRRRSAIEGSIVDGETE